MKQILFVGAGGLGCAASVALASEFAATPRELSFLFVDDDEVALTNLHRQILFDEADLDQPKAEAAARFFTRRGFRARAHVGRILPATAAELLRGIDLVIEGADNYATEVLAADACLQAALPIVHAGAVGWEGWALFSRSTPGAPSLRSVFEGAPLGPSATCATAGVIGPVVGTMGGIEALLATEFLRTGQVDRPLVHYEGKRDRLRRVAVQAPLKDDARSQGSSPRSPAATHP